MKSALQRNLCLAVLLSAVTACSSSSPKAVRVDLTGNVTVDGVPVLRGVVYFEPDVAQGNTGPQGVAEISDGVYKTRPNFGVVAGPQLTRVIVYPEGDTSPRNPDPKSANGVPTGEFVTHISVRPQSQKINLVIESNSRK
jgi:hypothetical protein